MVLEQLIKDRYGVYAQADITVETKDENLRKTLGKVLRGIENFSRE